MAKKTAAKSSGGASSLSRPAVIPASRSLQTATAKLKSSALLDTRVVYCGDNLEQLAKLPDAFHVAADVSRLKLL